MDFQACDYYSQPAYISNSKTAFNRNRLSFGKDSEANTNVSIFYINDVHAQVPRMQQLASAANEHDVYVKSTNQDSLKLASGDILLGKNETVNNIAVRFLALIGLNALALGNHEFDNNADNLYEAIKNAPFKVLGMNLNFPENDQKLSKTVLRGTVEEVNGNRYGIIGVVPSSLSDSLDSNALMKGITVDNVEQTIVEIQEEVEKLKEQGINKIILLSHSGLEVDKEMVKKLNGVDIILGGHSHDLIEGVKPGENYFITEDNEPVIITQAGRDGDNYGVLDVEFDKNGVIVDVKNNVQKTSCQPVDPVMKYLCEKYLGEKIETIGFAKKIDSVPTNRLIAENPYASFIADAMRSELNCDIALVNSGNLRGAFDEGEITNANISSIVPFKNKVVIIKLTEEELVKSLDFFSKSVNKPDTKPGLLQVSGLRYEVEDGNLDELYFVDNNGKKHEIDIENPRKDKVYLVATDNYVASANECPDEIKKLNTKDLVQIFEFDKDKLAIDYIKKMNNKPFEIKSDGRIKIDD